MNSSGNFSQKRLSFYDSTAVAPVVTPEKRQNSSSTPAFAVRCYKGPGGKVARKEEYTSSGNTLWDYAYDAKGHLVAAKRNGILMEKYVYNASGARIRDYRSWRNDSRDFRYDEEGRLSSAGNCRFTWTSSGNLRTQECNGKTTRYSYGDDTRLDGVLLPSEVKITYEYGDELLPVRIDRNGLPIMEFGWKNGLLLTRHSDIANSIINVFSYDGAGMPKQVRMSGPEAVVARLTGQPGAHVIMDIYTDQIGSVRLLQTPEGEEVKRIDYDSFGNVMYDSRPELYFPLGFGGGLVDPFKGFTRFGFRDYDPNVGRFTAKDPLGDTGGDHDLYDYCVDDPVGFVDPEGLNPANALHKSEKVDQHNQYAENVQEYNKLMIFPKSSPFR